MMKSTVLLLVALLSPIAAGQVRVAEGTVTYLGQGMVYTSLGRVSGLEDSAVVAVIAHADTVALLKVFALSSKSSACTVLRSRRPLVIGDTVVATVEFRQTTPPGQAAGTDTSAHTQQSVPGPPPAKTERAGQAPPVDVKGRVSLQYFGNTYDTHAFDFAQSGMVVNLRAQARDIPLRFEVYGNFRTLSVGTTRPFARGGTNQTRLYRLSLEYDDGPTFMALGRIIPSMAPMTGYIDGGLFARTFGDFTFGVAGGYQPNLLNAGVTTDYRKVALLARYQIKVPANVSVSAAYQRTYFLQQLDRESGSAQIFATISDRWFVFGLGELDLRRKIGDALKLHPSLSQLSATVNYRVNDLLTVGGGADASRPIYPYSFIRMVPDSLLDRRLRSGATFSVTLSLAGGFSFYNTYNPRASTSGFGNEYANTTSLSLADVFASGVAFRSNYTVGANEFTHSRGYGASLHRNILTACDLTVRYQQNSYRLFNSPATSLSSTTGADLLFSITRALSLMATYDRIVGLGANSHSLFTELSMRF